MNEIMAKCAEHEDALRECLNRVADYDHIEDAEGKQLILLPRDLAQSLIEGFQELHRHFSELDAFLKSGAKPVWMK